MLFRSVDWDGKIRMDCSSPYAMARLIGMRDRFEVAFANDTDADRHGIVTRSGGLMNPNHYLATAIGYLFENRPQWSRNSAIGNPATETASTSPSAIASAVVTSCQSVICGAPQIGNASSVCTRSVS